MPGGIENTVCFDILHSSTYFPSPKPSSNRYFGFHGII